MLSVSLLGDFSITYAGKPVTGLDSPRLQSLLAYLILHRDAPQSRAYLAYLFWPDTSEDQARTNLRNLLHHLRHSLPDADCFLGIKPQTLQWRPDAPSSLDVTEFEAALEVAEQAKLTGNTVRAQDALNKAIALYKGDLLPGCYEDWIIPLRERYHQVHLNALENLVRILEEQRDYPASILIAQFILQLDPLHEATYRQLIRLHALNGDRAGALRVYHTCTTILQRELDVEPSAATREAYQQLLGAEPRPAARDPASIGFAPLVGRNREWQQMHQAWRTVVAGGQPHLVVLRGEAGIGKTRLLEDMLQWATRQGVSCANSRCYAAEGALAYAPVTTWLRTHPITPLADIWLAEVARLLPEIFTQRPDLPVPVPLTEAWQRQRLFEALSRAILGINQPLLLTIDDLQWCDRDTLEWIHFLLRMDCTARFLIVGAYRSEEVLEKHPLVSTLQALRLTGQVTEIELEPLDETDTFSLARQVAIVEINRQTAQFIYQETEGNPLFVVETVRAGLPVLRTPGIPNAPIPGELGMPLKVRTVLEARLAQLTPKTRQLAELAAVIGREFSFMLLAKASGNDQDTLVRSIDELWQKRIVREHGTDAYDFSHDKLREFAYHEMSTARQRLLHHHVAQALEALQAANLDPVSHQVAAHYERASLPEKAIPYYLRAARVARQVYANDEAVALLQRGLALVADGQSTGSQEQASRLAFPLWEELGDILELKAQHDAALNAYNNAQSWIPAGDQIDLARIFRKQAGVLREQRQYSQALIACDHAEDALGSPGEKDSGHWWDEWIEVKLDQVWSHYWLAQWPEMDALLNKVQPIAQAHGSSANITIFLMASCLLNLRRYRYVISDEMLANARLALDASREWGNLKNRVYCQFELGFLHLWRRELAEAESALRAALQLAETSGMVPQQILSLTYLTIIHRMDGHVDQGETFALCAQEAARAAQMPDYIAAARGNLAWIAWRRQDLPKAEQLGLEALDIWRQSPLVYPFQWMALWPLIGVELTLERQDEVWKYCKALLEPTQQRLPDELNQPLEAALQSKAAGDDSLARTYLDRATALARQLGYL